MPSFTDPIPLFAIYAGCASLFLAVLLVLTKQWHGKATMDSNQGVQKVHLAPTPRVGGVAIMVGVLVGNHFAHPETQALLWPLIVAGIPAFAFGLLEDLTKQVSVRTRLLATMSCGVMGWLITGESLSHLNVPGIDWLLSFTLFSVLFTAFAVGGVANAINIIDGFNGLAAGTVIIILTAFGAIATSMGDTDLALTSLILAGAVAGFALVNWPFGKLFLGDGGAYFVGFAIAWIAVLLVSRHPEMSPWAPLLVCGYPVLEVLFSIVRRKRRDVCPGDPDRLHLHSLVKRRLVRKWLPQSSRLARNSVTGATMWAAALLPAATAMFWFDNTAALVLGLVACASIYSVAYGRLSRFQWFPQRLPRNVSLLKQNASRGAVGGDVATVASHSKHSEHPSSIKISVVTATWNSAGTVLDALNSISHQTHPHIEQVWVDGASTDGTQELLAARLKHCEASLVSEPDGGIYDALNKGLKRATGDVIGFLHADDILADAHVLTRIAAAFEDPTVNAVYGDLKYVQKNNPMAVVRYWRAGLFNQRKLSRGWMPPHPTLYLRSEIFERLGGFDPNLRIAADYDFILRAFTRAELNAVYLPAVLVKMRVGGASNRSLSNILRKSREDLTALRRNRVGGLWTLAWKNLIKIEQFRPVLSRGELSGAMRSARAWMDGPMLPARKRPDSDT